MWRYHKFSKGIKKGKGNEYFALFPIRLDDSMFETTEQWAYEIRQRHSGDFRNWKNHGAYQKGIRAALACGCTGDKPIVKR